MTTATKIARDGAAVTGAALVPVAETFATALAQTGTVAGELITGTTVGIESAAMRAQELLAGGVTGAVKKVAGLTVEAYQQVINQQLGLCVVLADALQVDWVGDITRRNATTIGELVAVSVAAAHDLLQSPGGSHHQ
jgi:hypothetical protein